MAYLEFTEFPNLIKYYTIIGNGTLLKEDYTNKANGTILKDIENFMYLTQPHFSEDTPNQILHILSTKECTNGYKLAEQQVNNNNKKTKQQIQEQLSKPLKTYVFGNFENCLLNTEIVLIYHCWYIVLQIHSPVKEIFHCKWGLIGNVVGFCILPTAGYESLTLFLYVS